MHISSFPRLAAGMVAASLAACAGETVVQGECQAAFGGDICTWGTTVGSSVIEFGATVPVASVKNAPADVAMEPSAIAMARLALPEAVAGATGFDHLSVDWEPHGHPPGLFLTPHFDFHFYTIDPARVEAIDCADLTKPTAVPAGYTLPDLEIPGMGLVTGLCVPGMGMHAMLESELDDTEPFGASMLLGFYHQDLVFLEPMISQAKLMEEQSFTMDVPAVQDPGVGVTFPTAFEAVYDAETRAYRFVFSLRQSN